MENSALQEAFCSAAAILGVNAFVDARFRRRAGLGASVRLRSGKISASVSDGYAAAPRSVLVGLALSLMSKIYHRRVTSPYIDDYKEFSSRESVSKLHDALRRGRGRKRTEGAVGRAYDLGEILTRVRVEYADVLAGVVSSPSIVWSSHRGSRVLGFHDSAFSQIVINRILDNPRVPEFVVEYVVFHELLHCKHRVLFQRGKSMRRTVHSGDFKKDEKKFRFYAAANAWLSHSRGILA
ncbi:MAG: M48 family peptidase [Candidatus Micrarchaeota archaeon]